MSPCSNNFSSFHHIRMSDRDNVKIRKPMVEKMRRDRINSCIEQLKVILEKEFQKQEPNSKLEKADILEMTVSFLRQQLQSSLCHQSYNHSWRDSVHVLSAGANTDTSHPQQQQDQRVSSSSSSTQQDGSSRRPVWRPW
uniref:Transcription factor HES-5 n=1 Tax=Nothobranchius rachovii TaxID=451742 RepID=A0A1A8RTR2_9TELE